GHLPPGPRLAAVRPDDAPRRAADRPRLDPFELEAVRAHERGLEGHALALGLAVPLVFDDDARVAIGLRVAIDVGDARDQFVGLRAAGELAGTLRLAAGEHARDRDDQDPRGRRDPKREHA